MAIYRGPGGAGDATTDSTSQAIIAVEAAAAAQVSASSAASSASGATTSATNAANSASNASTSATNAANSASSASTSATNASNSASAASTSATNASNSASAAATSATNAANSASSAATSATNAADASRLSVGTTTTGAAGSSVSVSITGAAGSQLLNLTIPKGDTGATGSTGAAGAAATISVGTTTTGAAGTSATVTNVGTSSDAIFNFSIPKGADGTGIGTVTSVDMTVPTGLTVTGNPITSSGTLAVSLESGFSIPTTSSQTNWDTAYTDRNKWDGGATGLVAATGRTSLGLGTIATLSAPSGTVVGTSDTQTLTNKRITARLSTTTSSATPTINTDNVDIYGLTAQTADITSFTTNLSGTPSDGQKLWIYIVGTGTRAITWGTSFESSTATLPTTTISTNRLDVGFVWNAATSKWRCVATA